MPLKLIVIPVTPFQQNCSILWCEETMQGTVIDPGGEVERIIEETETRKIGIERILVTHGHADHCGGVADLRDRLGVPVDGPHEDDRFWIEQLPEQALRFGLEPGRAFEPDRWLTEGDEVTVGNITFQVIHCPGHTPGHVAIRLASQGDEAVMCGDLMHVPIQCPHPEWSPLFDHDLDEARQTRRRFLEHAGETGALVLTAHFPSPSVGRVRPKGEAFTFDYLNG